MRIRLLILELFRMFGWAGFFIIKISRSFTKFIPDCGWTDWHLDPSPAWVLPRYYSKLCLIITTCIYCLVFICGSDGCPIWRPRPLTQGSDHKLIWYVISILSYPSRIQLISYKKSADADIVTNESRKQRPMVRLNSEVFLGVFRYDSFDVTKISVAFSETFEVWWQNLDNVDLKSVPHAHILS